MVHSFILPQETIASIQERLEILERCLNDVNPQDEAMAGLIELANNRQISLSQLGEEFKQFRYKLNKFSRLSQEFDRKVEQDELEVLFFVRYNFIFKEVLDQYWDFLLNKEGREFVKSMMTASVSFYKKIKIEANSGSYKKNEEYIFLETLKHVIQSLIIASLRVNALSEEEIDALDLGDITPQESETMLTSLASMRKWDWVYRNLA